MWIARHPWQFASIAVAFGIGLTAIQLLVTPGRLVLLPYVSLNPATWWPVVSGVFRAFPLLVVALVVVPVATLVTLVAAWRAAARAP